MKHDDVSLKEESLNIPDTEENLQKSEVETSSSTSHSDDDSSFIKTRVSGLVKESDPEEDFDDFVKSSPGQRVFLNADSVITLTGFFHSLHRLL